MKNLQQIRRELHQIPEIGFQEYKTQAYLLEEIYALNQERLTIVKWKTGFVVHVNGLNPTKLSKKVAEKDHNAVKKI